jgi:UDP-2,3-diacylglucosamine pyrophosphatase LpxH
LTEFLKRNDCERLYLVGDIFDGWKMKSRFYWTPDHSRVIKTIISKARRGTKVFYLTGNHDDFMRQFVRSQLRLGRVRLANEIVHATADGRRLLVMHGDSFDEVVSSFRWLAYAGDAGYETLMWLTERTSRFNPLLGLPPDWSLSAFTKTQVKAAVQYLSGFDEKVIYRCQRDNLHGVICGHTHHAEARQLRHGLMSYNCGDWVESCTALAEDFSGHIRILDGMKTMQAVAAPKSQSQESEVPVPLPRAAARARERKRQLRARMAKRVAAPASIAGIAQQPHEPTHSDSRL